jgi:hypothetical protein
MMDNPARMKEMGVGLIWVFLWEAKVEYADSVLDMGSFDNGGCLWRKRGRPVCREGGWTVVITCGSPIFGWFQNNGSQIIIIFWCF